MSTVSLQLAVVATLVVLALGAAAPAAPTPAAVAATDDQSAAQSASVQASIEEDVTNTAEGSKVNKKRSQPSSSSGNLLGSSLQQTATDTETVSLSPQVADPKKKGNAIQGVLLNILQPKPIVDTIREEDKYGNTGDKLSFIGRGVVAGFEGFSNILNKVLDFPFETAKKVSRSATEALNNLGSKLIGL